MSVAREAISRFTTIDVPAAPWLLGNGGLEQMRSDEVEVQIRVFGSPSAASVRQRTARSSDSWRHPQVSNSRIDMPSSGGIARYRRLLRPGRPPTTDANAAVHASILLQRLHDSLPKDH